MSFAALALVAGLGLVGGGIWGAASSIKENKFSKEYNNYKKELKDKGLEDVSTKELIEDLWLNGSIDDATYKNALSKYARLEDNQSHDGFFDTVGDFFSSAFKSKDTYNDVVDLYKTITAHAPDLSWSKGKTYDEIVDIVNGSLHSNLPKLDNIPSPQTLDVMFPTSQITVTDPKYWSASEMAELHNINFDPNHYYDLIKQGTSANVKYGQFTNRQLDALANSQDTKSVTSYLDSIRNAKAEAIANGATMGAKAAAELLANTEAINAQAGTQAQLATSKAQNMDALLQADAQANLSARQYFDQLAQALANDAVLNYTEAVDAYGQEVLTNADLYSADQELRGERLLANAEMEANYLQGQSQINAQRAQLNADANEYTWLFETALKANGGDVYKAYHATNDYIFNNINRNKGNDRTTYINDLIS